MPTPKSLPQDAGVTWEVLCPLTVIVLGDNVPVKRDIRDVLAVFVNQLSMASHLLDSACVS